MLTYEDLLAFFDATYNDVDNFSSNLFFDTFRMHTIMRISRGDCVALLWHLPRDVRLALYEKVQSLSSSQRESMDSPPTPLHIPAVPSIAKSKSAPISRAHHQTIQHHKSAQSSIPKSNSSSSVMEGWMWKLGRRSHIFKGKQWKRRWFKLKGRLLEWSKQPGSPRRGKMSIDTSHSLLSFQSKFPHTFGFRIWSSDVRNKKKSAKVREELRLLLKEPSLKREWMDVLKDAKLGRTLLMTERNDALFEKTTKKKKTNLGSIFASPPGDTNGDTKEEEKGSSRTNDHYIQTIASVLCPSPLGVSRESFLKFSGLCPELVRVFSPSFNCSYYSLERYRYNTFVRVF